MSNQGHFVFPKGCPEPKLQTYLAEINENTFKGLLVVELPQDKGESYLLSFREIDKDESLFQLWRDSWRTISTEHRRHDCAFWVEGLLFNELSRRANGYWWDDCYGRSERWRHRENYPTTYADWKMEGLREMLEPEQLTTERVENHRYLFHEYESLFVPPALRGEWTLTGVTKDE